MLLDNKSHGRVVDALRQHFTRGASVSILTNDLSVFAWNELKAALDHLKDTRLLLSAPTGGATAQEAKLLGGPQERRLRNSLAGPRLARLMDEWLGRPAVQVRSTTSQVPHSLYYAKKPDGQSSAVHGSSAFTAPGLGLTPSERFELNTLFTDNTTEGLLAFFEGLWSASGHTQDARAHLAELLRAVYEPSAPQTIYFQALFHLFGKNIEALDEDHIVRARTGIRDTLVWRKLYRFQRDGVVGAIDKLERYNGCILADSVGLGKTFEALAIIKYYELRNDRVLVLAPKRLRDNWTLYTVNDKRNLFAGDRFNYDVLNHSDLTRQSGRSGEINLDTLNWGNYDLVVIDESHNFRNNPPRRDGLTRYGRLMRDIIRAGVRTKVLMLSATPVNSRMNDLKNQVAFITEGADDALCEAGIPSIENTLRKAQTLFNHWLRLDADQRTTQSLLDKLNLDYFQLLDLLTIARSRKHIARYYDLQDMGRFPRRAPPINVKADIDTADLFPSLHDVNRDIRKLNLSAYAPLRYVLPHKVPEYSRRYDMEVQGGRSFRQLDREESLIHLMRVNLLKRMESSISSFAQTVGKLLGKVRDLMARIDARDSADVEELSIEEIDIDSDELDPHLVGAKVKVLLQDVDRLRWRQDLAEDAQCLAALLRDARQVDAARDEKLRRLKEIIQQKVQHPINAGNRKVIVFTAFADTADYLYEHLADWARAELGLYTAVVTGRGNSNRTNLKGLRTDLGSVLTAFSPISKERAVVDADATTELDLLIGTDCISEGQNLQDCDYLINYDIHWNPVRIIQRFGRIDRLGSHNDLIQLVNFWPNMELDEYINLEARVSGRMVLLDISATGEENVIESTQQDQMNDLAYRRRQFEQLQQQVLDIEDLSSGISITDLTLNDFRMDLARHLKRHRAEMDALPLGLHAAVTLGDLGDEDGLAPGVFFCLRDESAAAQHDRDYPLAPHYLVYVGEDGATRLNYHQTRRTLELMKRIALGRDRPDPRGAAAFEAATRKGLRMGEYQELLARAVAAISGKSEEQGVASLFERGGTALTRDSFRGVDDYEVVAWLAVLEEDEAR
jgi:superfamily II DNA or RNA helicase